MSPPQPHVPQTTCFQPLFCQTELDKSIVRKRQSMEALIVKRAEVRASLRGSNLEAVEPAASAPVSPGGGALVIPGMMGGGDSNGNQLSRGMVQAITFRVDESRRRLRTADTEGQRLQKLIVSGN